LPNGGSTYLKKRDLALKWYENGAAKYFTFKFALADKNFTSVSIVIESASAWATKDEMTTNTVKFTNDGTAVSVSVNDGTATTVSDTDLADLTLELAAASNYGEFGVLLNANPIGTFTNVGANFAENTTDITPFTVKAEVPVTEGEETPVKTVVELISLNGQSLALADGKLTDSAAPVLVINEELNGFMLGTQYAVSAETIDVLETSLTTTVTYYQYNPTTENVAEAYKTMPSTKPYFSETVYKGTDDKMHSVFEDEGKEYISVKYTLKDKSDLSSTVELAWYAAAVAEKDGVQYITMDRNDQGASYTFLTKDDTNKTQTFAETQEYKDFVAALKVQTEDENGDPVLVAGSETEFLIPTLKGLIDDNNGYSNLKFTICYRNVEGEKTASNLTVSKLKLTLARAGRYEFKIFAVDKAGNQMKYYLDGEEVEVTSSNIWKIEEIPSFWFDVADAGLSVEDDGTSDRHDDEKIGGVYSPSDINVLGDKASSVTKEFALFKVDVSKFEGEPSVPLTEKLLYEIEFETLQSRAAGRLLEANGDYLKFYKKIYAECLAERMGNVTADELLACEGLFVEILPVDSRIDKEDHPDEWKKNNQYNFSATDGSFTAVDQGTYIVLGVFSDAEIASRKVAAYRVVFAEDKDDFVEGEMTEWLKNNLVSVILFAIAGVMLIVIIVLLFIKPSDETLEYVEKKAVKGKKEKKSKN
ncbi:MAG: hypothetical protein IJB97_07930, partial [Clostridia bacterium]|nr:hypothetical protein [Clostridia bacterium]